MHTSFDSSNYNIEGSYIKDNNFINPIKDYKDNKLNKYNTANTENQDNKDNKDILLRNKYLSNQININTINSINTNNSICITTNEEILGKYLI